MGVAGGTDLISQTAALWEGRKRERVCFKIGDEGQGDSCSGEQIQADFIKKKNFLQIKNF